MLHLCNSGTRLCDGLSRRAFLSAGHRGCQTDGDRQSYVSSRHVFPPSRKVQTRGKTAQGVTGTYGARCVEGSGRASAAATSGTKDITIKVWEMPM